MRGRAVRLARPILVTAIGAGLFAPAYDFYVTVGGRDAMLDRYVDRPVDVPLSLVPGTRFAADFAVTKPSSAGRWLIVVDPRDPADRTRVTCALVTDPDPGGCAGIAPLRVEWTLTAGGSPASATTGKVGAYYGHAAMLTSFQAARGVAYRFEGEVRGAAGAGAPDARLVVRTDPSDREEKGLFGAAMVQSFAILCALFGLFVLVRGVRGLRRAWRGEDAAAKG